VKYHYRALGLFICVIGVLYSLLWIVAAVSVQNPAVFFLIFPTSLITWLGFRLFKKGQSVLKLYRTCIELALKQLREKGAIDSYEISTTLGHSEIEIRQVILRAQDKRILPISSNANGPIQPAGDFIGERRSSSFPTGLVALFIATIIAVILIASLNNRPRYAPAPSRSNTSSPAQKKSPANDLGDRMLKRMDDNLIDQMFPRKPIRVEVAPAPY
tara:strand:- start:92 stop:736 length:645 start_codon:yes stop_codon:yes gene_type:complete